MLKFICILLLVYVSCSTSSKAQDIRGKLTEWRGSLPAKFVKVIVVPRTREAEKLLKDNLFFYGDNLGELKDLNAIATVTDENGIFYFNGLRQGRYLLKVCETYGILYAFKVLRSGNELLKIKDMSAYYTDRSMLRR